MCKTSLSTETCTTQSRCEPPLCSVISITWLPIFTEKYSLFSWGSMACTKQTHRNPDLERPTVAMGSDVQPEKRVPSKPTSNKVATKGGKQPRKHLLHKLIRHNKSTTGG